MKLTKNSIYLSLILAMAISGCVKQKFDTPELAEFASASTGNKGTYIVLDDPNSVFKIPVGITTSSSKDRTINFTVTSPSGAVAGTQYTISGNSVTIPAGKVVDSISIKGLFAGYPSGRKDTLILTITDGSVKSFTGATTYTLIVQGYCPVVLADFAGQYDNANDAYASGNVYGPYSVFVTPGVTNGTTGTLIIDNIYDPGVPVTTTVNLDWTDPLNFKTSIPDQKFTASGSLWIKSDGIGTFSSCNNTITVKYILYTKSTGALYDEGVTVIER